MHCYIRPDANGLNALAQGPQPCNDPKQMALNTGAFASIGLADQQKLLEAHMDAEKSVEIRYEIDVAGATPKLD